MSAEYTPPLLLDSGRVELDTTPDSDGDIELIATLEDMHVAYLRPADQIAVRDLLNRLHPPQPRTVTTVEELDALPVGSIARGSNETHAWGHQIYEARLGHAGEPPRWGLVSMPLDAGISATDLLQLSGSVKVLHEGDSNV